MMEYSRICEVLENNSMEEYLEAFKKHKVTDHVMDLIVSNAALAEPLKEIIPDIGPRILLMSSFNSIAVQLSQPPIPNEVKCTLCNSSLKSNWDYIWEHMKNYHGKSLKSRDMLCPVCNLTFSWCKSLKVHFIKCHSPKEEISNNTQHKTPKVDSPLHSKKIRLDHTDTFPDESQRQEPIIISEMIHELKQKVTKYFISLECSGRFPISLIQDVIGSTKSFILDMVCIIRQLIPSPFNYDSELMELENIFSIVSSSYRIEMYLRDRSYLIEPEEIVLGSFYKNVIVQGKQTSKLAFDTLQYIPIRKTLVKILEVPGVMESVIEKTNSRDIESQNFSNFMDGSYIQSRDRETHHTKPIVYLLIYFDELEICNPLGARSGKNKLALFYYTILNIDSRYNSKLDNIILCTSMKSSVMKKYPTTETMRQIIHELKELLRTDGISVKTDTYTGKVQVELAQVIGDNLGLHQILGYSESFVANFPCRLCKMKRSNCQTSGRSEERLLRNRENYADDLRIDNMSETGLKHRSILNDVQYFHVTDNYSVDIMHDLLEGVIPLDVKLVFNQLISKPDFSLEQLNSRIQLFDYGYQKKDKPSLITVNAIKSQDTKLGQSASQTLCLFQNLHLLFGDQFDMTHQFWKLITTLTNILDIVMAPSVSAAAVNYLENLIDDHHILYMQLSKSNLRPKHHHLTHYPGAIRKLGPLLPFWVMRQEARHRFFKHVSNICNNFKHIVKTVTTRNQQRLAHQLLISEEFRPGCPEFGKEFCVKLKDFEFSNVFIESNQMDLEEYVNIFQSITLNGYNISRGNVLLRSWCGKNSLPEFVEEQPVPHQFRPPFQVINCTLSQMGEIVLQNATTDNPVNQNESLFSTPPNGFESLNPQAIRVGGRQKRRKLFYDEEPNQQIINVRQVLLDNDREFQTTYGTQILELAESRTALSSFLRKHLVRVSCQHLIKIACSHYPSTNQKSLLADCLTNQLYPYLGDEERKSLKESYFTGSQSYLDKNGKKKSRQPNGYIYTFFKNHWTYLKAHGGNLCMTKIAPCTDTDSTVDAPNEDELNEMISWLQHSRAPQIKVFDFLERTFSIRQNDFMKCNEEEYRQILKKWPRLFDITGAIQNDFRMAHPLIANNLLKDWNSIGTKLLNFCQSQNKSISNIGINVNIPNDKRTMAALFMLPYMIRSKVRKIPQKDCVKHFIEIIQIVDDINLVSGRDAGRKPFIVCKGVLFDLEFEEYFVVVESKAIRCESLLESVDLAFKCFHIFNLHFPNECYGAWEFLDYAVFKMPQKSNVCATVKEMSAFVQ